jgi:adenylate cyclase
LTKSRHDAPDDAEQLDTADHGVSPTGGAPDDDIDETPADQMARLLGEVLERPAPEGARIIVLHWLMRLERARAAWSEAIDPPQQREATSEQTVLDASTDDAATALHKMRVALRRLRAALQEYRALLVGGPSKKQIRHLRALNLSTGAARDADVQRAWLDAESGAMPDIAGKEAAALRTLLSRESRRHAKRVRTALDKHFDTRVKALQDSLMRYHVHGTVGVALELHTFAPQVAVRLDRSVSRVVRSVGAAHQVSDTDALHRARKALKSLRALLVPFVSQLPSLGTLYDSATRGQDTLGAMRDAALLAERARHEGFDALAAELDNVQLGHFNAFASEWMDDAGARALVGFEAARQALHAASRTAEDLHDEHGDSLPMEIERKYLLRGCPPEAAVVAGTRIEQGWMPGRVLRERLRCSTYPTGVSRFTRTVKAGSGLARIELEEDTTRTLFDVLWPLTAAARVRKRRHAIREGGYTWEIDVFTDRELVLAEVELSSVRENPPLPSWLAEWVVRDVTGEREYYNSTLARPDADAGGDATIQTAAV